MPNSLRFAILFGSVITLAFVSEATAQNQIAVLQNFDGDAIPRNGDGDTLPSFYENGESGTGTFQISQESTDAISGKSIRMHVTRGNFYMQFNPYNYAKAAAFSSPRGWAREYAIDRSKWHFNTYNRLSFWIKLPAEPANVINRVGNTETDFGTYVKCISLSGCPDYGSDEAGGGHWYHKLNPPRTGTWVHVILNMVPDHIRGAAGRDEHPAQTHPTNESQYNYFDTLTRFYIQDTGSLLSAPYDYLLDELTVYQEPAAEPDKQVRGISSTYVPESNRVIVTWFRNKDENDIVHEVRYAFSDIHELGWEKAIPDPKGAGLITPPGWQGYNGMFYDTTALPLNGRSEVFIAIKPLGNNPDNLFTQVRIALNAGQQKQQPQAPTNLRLEKAS